MKGLYSFTDPKWILDRIQAYLPYRHVFTSLKLVQLFIICTIWLSLNISYGHHLQTPNNLLDPLAGLCKKIYSIPTSLKVPMIIYLYRWTTPWSILFSILFNRSTSKIWKCNKSKAWSFDYYWLFEEKTTSLLLLRFYMMITFEVYMSRYM